MEEEKKAIIISAMGKKWVKEIESREVKGRLIENITFETFAQKIEKSWKVRDGDT